MTRLPALPGNPTLRLEPVPEPLPWPGTRRTIVPADPHDPAWALEVERAQPSLDPVEPALPRHLATPVVARWEDEPATTWTDEPPLDDDPWFDEGTLAPAPAREPTEVDLWARHRRRTRLLTRLGAAALAGALVAAFGLAVPQCTPTVSPEPLGPVLDLPTETALHLPIRRGDTFATLVGDRVDAMALVGAAAPLADLNRIEAGRRLVLVEEAGEVVGVRYAVDEARTLVLHLTEQGWRGRME